jgi:F0F1-type ATP synthase assembly protein I
MTNDRRYPSGGKRGKRGKRGPKVDEWRGVGSFGTIGLEIVLSIALGFFGGRWLDEKFATAPYLAGVGFVFGLAAAIKAVMRAHAEMQVLAAKEEREQGNPLPIYDARDDERKNADIEKNNASESSDEDTNDDDSDDSDDNKNGKAER